MDGFFPFFPYLLIYHTEEYAGSNPARSTKFHAFLHEYWRISWFFIIFYYQFKKIVFLFFTKVDGHMYRGNRDKCPEHP